MKVIDLTHTISAEMPVYPGTEKPLFLSANSYERDGFKETKLCMYSHTGTHIDPPAHLFADKKTLDQFPVNQFIGKALVIDCREFKEGELVSLEHVLKYGERVKEAEFLLFCYGWDRKWGTDDYFGDYPCIDLELLDFIIKGNYKGIGFDVIGLDPIADLDLTRHNILFQKKDLINIENLKNLQLCGKDLFMFSCLPIKTEDADGAPCRAIAWFEEE